MRYYAQSSVYDGFGPVSDGPRWRISFAYSLDGVAFTALGGKLTVGRTWFEGIKFGLFTYRLSTASSGGSSDFDFFHYTYDGSHAAP